ncbi:MAG: aminotransferase class V-fold PLP-dependent enzyme [Ignavibacteria bacterium]|jgi:phosphoserine aminotransferase
MNNIFFTVGPTELFPEVKHLFLEAIKEKLFSISHRSKEFENINSYTNTELRKLLCIPEEFHIFYLSSATECMERIIQNLVEKRSFHFINGYFAGRFYSIAKQLKKKPYQKKANLKDGFKFDKIKIPENTELICFTQNETSTGMVVEMENIYKVKNNYPDKLITVDVVTSVPYINIDFNKIDCAFFSVQKGFGMPPGLGVMIIKKDCIEKTRLLKEKKYNIGSFNNFITLAENADKFQTAVTPNIPGIYLLGKVCKLLNDKGIDRIREETDEKANMIYEYFSKHKYIRPFISSIQNRSNTTLVFDVAFNSNIIVDKMKRKGFVISRGYRDFKESQIRIANFPMHKITDVKKLLGAFNNL